MLWRLADAVGLREGEAARAARLFGFVLLLVLAVALAKAAQQGIFLSGCERARIADAFIVSAIVLAAASFAVSAFAARVGPLRLFLALDALIAVLLVLAWAFTRWRPGADPMPLYVAVEVAVGLIMVQGWTVVSEALDVRSAKRLLPLVGNAAGVGWTIGGFTVRPLAAAVGAPGLLLCAAGLLAAAGAMAVIIMRLDLGGRPARGARGTTLWAGARAGIGYVARVPLLRATAILTVTGLLIEQLLDFQLFAAAQDHLGSNERIAGFMGTFFGVTGVISLAAPLVAGRILSRFGSAVAIPVPPAAVLVCATAFIVHPGFAVAVAGRGAYRVLDNALGAAGRGQTQTTIPPVRRAQAGALLKGVVAPLFYAAGGAVLKLVAPSDLRWLSAACLVLAAASVVVAWAYLRPAYVAALRRSLDERRLDLDADAGALDGEHVRMLAAEAGGDDRDAARFAVALLEEAGDQPAARRALQGACAHPDPEVRIRALDALGRVGAAGDAPAAAAALDGAASTDVRLAALGALVSLGLDGAGSRVRTCTSDPDLRVRALARAALSRSCAGGDASECCAMAGDLSAMLTAADPAERAAAVWAVGESRSAVAGLRAAVAHRFADADGDVRRATVRAAGRLRDPALAPYLVAALEDPATAPAAGDALARAGDAVVPAIERALPGASEAGRSRIAAALAAGSGPHGDALLAGLLEHDHRVVRYRAARALAARRRAGPWRAPPRSTILAAVDAELHIGYGYYQLLAGIARTDGVVDLDIEPEYRFLAGEVEVRITQTQRRLLAVLALTADPALFRIAEDQLLGGDPRRAAAALELLEHALDPELRRTVVPFFDRRSLRLRMRTVERRRSLPAELLDDPLAGIMASGDQHLQRCALIGYGDDMARRYPEDYAAHAGAQPLIERLRFLRDVPLFHELSGEDLIQVAEIAATVGFAAGRAIFHKGDPSDEIYLVVRGQVVVRDGHAVIATLGPAEMLGELAALDGGERSASAVCEQDSELLRIGRADLDELMERRPQVAREIIRVLARRVRQATRRIVDG